MSDGERETHHTTQPEAGEQAHVGTRDGNGHMGLRPQVLITPGEGASTAQVNGYTTVTGQETAYRPATISGPAVASGGTAGVAGSNGHAQHNGHAQSLVGDIQMRVVQPPRCRYERFVKPAIDWLGGFVLFLLLLPVMAAVAVAVWVTLGSPVLIRQRRVGRDGREFGMLKFRTMRPDRRRQHVVLTAEADRRRTHKSADDPRHTLLGRLLRRTSLDELPQLLNVLAGHMSLVGPRPELADVVASVYEPWQLRRHFVKPGITGLWQVTERVEGNGVMHHHTAVDLTYIERLSFQTDLSILLRTPIAIVRTRRTE